MKSQNKLSLNILSILQSSSPRHLIKTKATTKCHLFEKLKIHISLLTLYLTIRYFCTTQVFSVLPTFKTY